MLIKRARQQSALVNTLPDWNEYISVLSTLFRANQRLTKDIKKYKAWNQAPVTLKECNTFASAKNEIKKFVKTIPI